MSDTGATPKSTVKQMEHNTTVNTDLAKLVNQTGEDSGTTPKSAIKQKRGDQTTLVQGLKIVYNNNAQASRPKKSTQGAYLSKTKSTGVTDSKQMVDIVAVPGLGADPSVTWHTRRKIESKQGKKIGSNGPSFTDGPSCIEDKSMLQLNCLTLGS